MLETRLSAWWQSIALIGAIIGVHVWLSVPTLELVSLQLFAVLILVFFVLKKYSSGRTWTVLPAVASIEMVLMTAALLLVVGATGNLDSPLFAITYIHLFLLVFTVHPSAAIVATAGLSLSHYALALPLTTLEATTLFTIPLGLVFFLIAREHYHELLEDRQLIKNTREKLTKSKQNEQFLERYMVHLLLPRLHQLSQTLSSTSSATDHTAAAELSTLSTEVQQAVEAADTPAEQV